MQDGTPVLDAGKFQELFDDFGDEAVEVIAEWLDEGEREVTGLLALLGAEPVDVPATQSAAHRLKGGCMMVGAALLQGVAAELDLLGKRAAPADELVAKVPALESAWARTRAELAPYLPET